LLRTVREGRGLSQARLAQRVGGSQQWLSQVERGVRNPTLSDLERFFGGLGLRLRFEAVPRASEVDEDPDLLLRGPEDERLAGVFGHCRLLGRLSDVPHVVGGRLAAMAHGMPVRVQRIDLIVARDDLELFAEAMPRFSTQRWSERWQAFCSELPARRPGPMRWLISGIWELRVAVADDLPERLATRLGEHELWVPSLPWLLVNDPDVADLLARLRAAGWHRPAGWPAGE
jgi:transcriptional regulator with XRE-family HTH domain